MKTVLAALGAIILVVSPTPGQVLNLTQSTNNTIISPTASISCNNGAGGVHVDNGYWRSYVIASEVPAAGGPPGAGLSVISVTFGVQSAFAGGGAGQQLAAIRLYRDASGGPGSSPAPLNHLVPLHVQPFMVPDTIAGPTFHTVTLNSPVSVKNSDTLVVELFTPDGTTAGNSFFIGANNLGQTGSAYVSAPSCGLLQPTATGAFGFPNFHMILDVTGVPASPTAQYAGTSGDLEMLSAVNGVPMTGGIGPDVKVATAGDVLNIAVLTPIGGLVNGQLLVAAEGFFTGSPPAPAFPGIAVSTSAILVVGGPNGPLGPALLPIGGFLVNFVVPVALGGVGASVLMQAVVPDTAAPNGIFHSADGHELIVL